MSTSSSVFQLRHRLSARLKKIIKNEKLLDKQLKSFDYIVSRRQFLGAAGKLTALAAVVNSGLAPSAWANENRIYEVKDPALQLTEEEKTLMAQPASITLSGELIDDQLLLKTGGEISNFEGHHHVVYGAHPMPYVETEQGEEVAQPNPIQMELISLEQSGFITHRHRNLQSGHGYTTDIVAPIWAGTKVEDCRNFAYSHPKNGWVDAEGYTVEAMISVLVYKTNMMQIHYRTKRTLVKPGAETDIKDSGWQAFNHYFGVFSHILVGDYPYIVTADGTGKMCVLTFGDLSDVANGSACLKMSNPYSLEQFFPDSKISYDQFNMKCVKLTEADYATDTYTFTWLPGGTTGWGDNNSVAWSSKSDPYTHDIIYTCQDDNGHPSLVMMQGNSSYNAIRYTTQKSSGSGAQYYNKLGKQPSKPIASSINVTSLVRGTDLEGEVKTLHRQINNDGLYSIVAHCQNKDTYRLGQFREREDDSSITSSFVPSSYLNQIGCFESEFLMNGGYLKHHWYPDSKNLLGVAVPPISNGEYSGVTFKQQGNEQVTTLVSQDKYTLTTHEEQLVVPMSQAEIDANVKAGQKQITDTFYHGELNVLDSNGCPVPAGVKVEIRSSRPCRLIDNHHGYAHTVSREHSVVIATNSMGRVVVSSRATDMTAPTLYARIYADDNSLAGDRILLSTKGADYDWFTLSADVDANKRMADESHTTTQKLRDAKLIDDSVPNEQANGVAEVLRGAGQQMSTRSNTPPSSSMLRASSTAFKVNPLNQISYIAGASNNKLMVQASGSWTIDLETGEVGQVSSSNLQAMALGGIFHSIGHTFSHIIHSIAHGVKAVINGVARTITKVTMEFGDVVSAAFHYIENGVEKAIKFVMDTVEHIAKTVYAVMTKVAKFIGDVVKGIIAFIKLLLEFADILALTRSAKRYINQHMDQLSGDCSQAAAHIKGVVAGHDSSDTSTIDTVADKVRQSTSPKNSNSSGNSSVHNYALNKFHSDAEKNPSGGKKLQLSIPSLGGNDTEETSDYLQLGDSKSIISSLISMMGKGFSFGCAGDMLVEAEKLIAGSADSVNGIVDLMAGQAQSTVDGISSMLKTEVPFIGWLLKLFGIDFTIEDVLCFVGAFGAHTMYAAAFGKSLRSVYGNGPKPTNLVTFSEEEEEGGGLEDTLKYFFYVFGAANVICVALDVATEGKATIPKILMTFCQLWTNSCEMFMIDTSNLPISFKLMPLSNAFLLLISVYARFHKHESTFAKYNIACLAIKVALVIDAAIKYNGIEEKEEQHEAQKIFACTGLDALVNIFEALEATLGEEDEEAAMYMAVAALVFEAGAFMTAVAFTEGWGKLG
ncbi:hypothetical protein L4C34_18130 [Vibrio profundum]|uniref:hypothetical protein n=1 Tax=Vibrio profundum TaxID=2910247 RepID=UPI003D0EC3F5